MHEEEIADCLCLMLESIKLIESRFQQIGSPGEFVQSSEGTTLLDAIVMRLQVIGESVRKIQKMDFSFLDLFCLKPQTSNPPTAEGQCLCQSVCVCLPNLSNGIFVAFIPSG